MQPVGFWGLSVEANKQYSQEVDTAFKISMAALGSEVKNGQRVTLYVKYEEQIQSDDEEEQDNKPSTPPTQEEFALCTLIAGKKDQQVMDLTFSLDEKVTFFSKGDAKIHLTGYHMMDQSDMGDMEGMEGMDSDDEEAMLQEEQEDDSGEEMTPETLATFRRALETMGGDEESMHSDDFEDVEGEEIMSDEDDEVMDEAAEEELNQVLIQKLNKKQEQPKQEKRKAEEVKAIEKKSKITEIKAQVVVTAVPKEEEVKKMTKGEKKAAAKAKQAEITVASPSKSVEKLLVKEVKKISPTPPQEVESKVSNIKTLPSGMIVEDVLIGNGPKAKKGKKVSVRYIGKLMNGKTFDSNTKGSPFSFKLGGGEVIKGWDMGVEGMHVGGTRKLTIPAALAYGAKGAKPDIPSNATLQFEVKLLDIKN